MERLSRPWALIEILSMPALIKNWCIPGTDRQIKQTMQALIERLIRPGTDRNSLTIDAELELKCKNTLTDRKIK